MFEAEFEVRVGMSPISTFVDIRYCRIGLFRSGLRLGWEFGPILLSGIEASRLGWGWGGLALSCYCQHIQLSEYKLSEYTIYASIPKSCDKPLSRRLYILYLLHENHLQVRITKTNTATKPEVNAMFAVRLVKRLIRRHRPMSQAWTFLWHMLVPH